MKRVFSVLLAVILTLGTTYAQKGSTGGGSDKSDKNNKKNNVPDTSDKTNKDDESGGGGGSLLDGSIFNVVTLITGKYHKSLLAKSKKVPIITSFELTADAGFAAYSGKPMVGYLNAFPQVRLNYGAYFADVKIDYLKSLDDAYDIKMLNASGVLGINLVGSQNFRAYIGAGLNYNLETKLYYPQAMLGADLGLMKRSIVITPELTYAYDFNESAQAYSEYGIRGAFRFFKSGSLNLYLNAGGDYRIYGLDYDMIHFYGGIEMLIQ